MANYIKIKKVESMQSRIATTVEGNWILEKWDNIKDIVRRVRKLGREVEERSNKSKVTQDHRLLLLLGKRLKNCLSCERGFLK